MSTKRRKKRKVPSREKRKPRKRWTQQDVIKEIEALQQRGRIKSLPSSATNPDLGERT